MSGSSRPGRTPVKAGGAEGRKSSGWARHFEGWQPGLLAVFLAGSSAAVAVPRPVEAVEVPEPEIEPRALERAARADDALARAAAERRPELDFDVRALGSAIYAYEKATAGDDDAALVAERKHVADAAGHAYPHGDHALLMLRAYELTSFLHALRRWEGTGVEGDELHEVGGDFVTMARHNGWIQGGKLIMDDAVRRALFKERWNDLVQVQGGPFALVRDEQRALIRFFLLHPPHDGPPGDQRIGFAMEQYRLKKIDRLAMLDPGYPADLARGVINFRIHRYPVAAGFFRRHLEAHPEGPLTLRAQNYLNAALARGTE